jgi:hypothetical protein
MARPGGLSTTQVAAAREISGEIAADSATLSDALFPPASALDCRGFDSIFVGVEITGGVSPTCTIEPIFRDGDAADQARWGRLLVGSPPGVTAASAAVQSTGALAPLTMVELFVFGRLVYLRRTAVTNEGSTTAMKILAIPGRPRVAPHHGG